MRWIVRPGAPVDGTLRVPGDKSIAHRWLILAATANGRSRLRDVPPSLDVRSTARCVSLLAPNARRGLDAWSSNVARGAERNGFTCDADAEASSTFGVEVEGDGRSALVQPSTSLDCGNSGTTMRLLAGVLAATPFTSRLEGDESLARRPMERVAEPLRLMGAGVVTTDGHAPLSIAGGALRGIDYRTRVPSAQVKSAVLLAGCVAEGSTRVAEDAPTRDHTERALMALGAPVEREGDAVSVERFQHDGFEGTVPGDVSSAAFLIGAAAVTGGRVEILDVGLNPTRTRFLDVLRRMGVEVVAVPERLELGEPVGSVVVRGPAALEGTEIDAEELPLVIDEVPLLAAVAAHARGSTWFLGAGELRVKESNRLAAIADCLRALGAHAGVEGEDLVVSGGRLTGGGATSGGDHRMAMAIAVAALAADAPVAIEGADAAEVSYPGFVRALAGLGADVEVEA